MVSAVDMRKDTKVDMDSAAAMKVVMEEDTVATEATGKSDEHHD